MSTAVDSSRDREASQRSVPRDALLSSGYRSLFVATLFLVCFFNFADRALFAVLAQTIKQDFGLSDLEIGVLQGVGFALLFVVLGVPIGRLAERSSRVRIIAIATMVWSVATAACGLTAGFFQLLLARVGVGIGEAGFMPPTASLVADHFPREQRASVMSLIMIGTPVGVFLGSIIGGAIAHSLGWRQAFFVLGIPGLIAGLLVLFMLREPSRGLVDGAAPVQRTPPNFRAFLGVVARKRALLFVIAGGAVAGFTMTAISQFMAIFLARAHHMPVREAAAYFGTISGVSLMVGFLLGSFGTDWLARRDQRWPAWGAAIGLCTAPFVYWIAFNTGNKLTAAVLLTVAGTLMLLHYGPTQGMIQNMLEPRMRATGAAVASMLYTLVGAGLGPTFIGGASDRFAQAAYHGDQFLIRCRADLLAAAADEPWAQACRAASTEGIRGAMMIAVGVTFAAGALFYIASRSIREHLYDPLVENRQGRPQP